MNSNSKITFKSLFTKDDKLFWGVIRDSLHRNDYELVWGDALEEFRKHKKPSDGKRNANLIGLKALQELGINWRQLLNEKKDNKQVAQSIRQTQGAVSRPEKGRTASGTKSSGRKSMILEMADNKS